MSTIQTLSSLKRHADHMVKDGGIKRAQALEAVSQSFGFKDYEHARTTLDRGLLEFRVSLDGILPAIERTFVIDERYSLEDLHFHIQAAMGWQTNHLYEFRIKAKSISRFCEIDTLSSITDEDLNSFTYIYDFGDNWCHTVSLLGRRPRKDAKEGAILSGARSCPPEDCGGVDGYERLLEILLDPSNLEYEETKDWVGDFQAEKFSQKTANETLDEIYSDIRAHRRNARQAQNLS